MANFKTHLITGAVIGGCVLFINDLLKQEKGVQAGQQPRLDGARLLGQLLLGAGIGGLAGVLPDILEPADNPHHRKACHSILFAFILYCGVVKLEESGLSPDTQICLQGGVAAYLSHLLLDMSTPMGLPLI
jgi:membrane-bound metal-dependent hydrolase YbcI (DUF457 family)